MKLPISVWSLAILLNVGVFQADAQFLDDDDDELVTIKPRRPIRPYVNRLQRIGGLLGTSVDYTQPPAVPYQRLPAPRPVPKSRSSDAGITADVAVSRPLGSITSSPILFENRIESFTNSAGTRFESVQLLQISVDGLVWAKQRSTNSASIALTSIPSEEYNRLGFPQVYLDELMEREDDRIMRAAFEKQAADIAARRDAQTASNPEAPSQGKKAGRAKKVR